MDSKHKAFVSLDKSIIYTIRSQSLLEATKKSEELFK